MAKYTYITATGPIDIEIDEHWVMLLNAADVDEQKTERKHTRPDHKYAPGKPLSLDDLRNSGDWLSDRMSAIDEADFSMDLEHTLRSLTKLQRRYFVLAKLKGYSYEAIAKNEGKCASTVRRLVESAAKKIRTIVSGKYF